jgi:hypothetical protein
MLGFSLRADLFMIRENHVFVVDVMVTNPMQETMTLNVISHQQV